MEVTLDPLNTPAPVKLHAQPAKPEIPTDRRRHTDPSNAEPSDDPVNVGIPPARTSRFAAKVLFDFQPAHGAKDDAAARTVPTLRAGVTHSRACADGADWVG